VNTSGVVVERFVYDAYGQVAVKNSGWSSTTDSYNWNRLHQGLEYDSAVGWYMNRNRIYSPTMLRFGQQDPMGYINGLDVYLSYAANPINRGDPSGEAAVRPPGQGLGVKVWTVTGPERTAFSGHKYSNGISEYPTAHWRFSVHAEFEGLACADLEYRQYVKGYMTIDGHDQKFSGAPDLNRTTYVEDHSGPQHYGHRNEQALWDDHYSMPNGAWNQQKGTVYDMVDSPGTVIDYTWFWGSTYTVEIHLDFLLTVIDPKTKFVYKMDDLHIYDSVKLTADKVNYPSNWRQLDGFA
jgi:RHS repeat-associated protein